MPKYKFSDIAFNSTQKKKPTEEDKEVYVGLEHLDAGSLVVSRWGAEVAPVGEKLLMKKGDVLFGKRRAYQKKVAIAPFDGIFSAHGMVLRPNEEIVTKEYFPLFISSDYFLDEAIRISVGSLSPTVNWKDLKQLEFNLPTIEEQNRIAPVIWAAIDAKNHYKTLIQATDDLVKSQFIEMFGDPVHNPLGWEKKKLIDVCTKLTDGTHFSPESFPEGDYKYITAKNIKEDGFDFTSLTFVAKDVHDSIYARCNPEFGDVLYIKDGVTTGIAMVNSLEEPFTLLSSVALLKQNRQLILGEFLCSVLNNAEMYKSIRSNMGGAAITRLTIKKLNEIEIVLPPLELQKKFVSLKGQADKSKFELQQAVEKIDSLIKSLIQ